LDAIETRGLGKSYSKFFSFKKTMALEDLDLNVPTGGIFGFLGLNGAGKTTTIKILLGLSHATSGSGSVLGRPLGDVKAKEKIGFLPEEAYFQRHLTAVEFLNFCARTLHMEADLRKSRIEEMLALVSMSDKANVKLSQFSKGMLQRVGVAQALLNDPDLVIFDEPLTGLDPKGRSQLKDIMVSLQKRGKTVFFSSHILSDVQAICDHVAILNRGHRIFQGQISDLLEIKKYDLKFSNIPSKYLDALEKISEGLAKDGDGWTIQAATEEQKAKICRSLEKVNIKPSGVSIVYKDLEPVFLERIEANNKERGLAS
jgi:ABC-2 type transport system ATP-binding protein